MTVVEWDSFVHMRVRIQLVRCLVVLSWMISISSAAQDNTTEKHIAVALRKIGHELLLNSGDSTTRVLPIQKSGDHYIIPFETSFGFVPDELVNSVTTIIDEAQIAKRYIVEVEKCDAAEVIYSFEIDQFKQRDIIPCQSRVQPSDCYNLLITILEVPETHWQYGSAGGSGSIISPKSLLIITVPTLLILLLLISWFRKKSAGQGGYLHLGKYQFDPRNATLILDNQQTELSGKEADLLQLLYRSVNATVKKETLLQEIWGDEGSYVGRTLDVFISKLRNKLQGDPGIKIVNSRGVGYKLVINE